MEMGETWPETQELPFQLKKKERKEKTKGLLRKSSPNPSLHHFNHF